MQEARAGGGTHVAKLFACQCKFRKASGAKVPREEASSEELGVRSSGWMASWTGSSGAGREAWQLVKAEAP